MMLVKIIDHLLTNGAVCHHVYWQLNSYDQLELVVLVFLHKIMD